MKKALYKSLLISLLLTTIIGFTSCKNKDKHDHDYYDATCTTPAICKICEQTKGDALGHTWAAATCMSVKTCSVCGETEGTTLEHEYLGATCLVPATCKLCGNTSGEALGHSWIDATVNSPKTCERCQITQGLPLEQLVISINSPYMHLGTMQNLRIENYYISDFNIEYSDEGIISIDEWGTVKSLKEGTVEITFTNIYNSKLKNSISIEVIEPKPICYLLYDKMLINNTTPITFKNLEMLKEKSIEDFNVTFENGNILSFGNNTLKAIAKGNETITITSKLDERISTTCSVSVVDKNSSVVIIGRDETGLAKAGEQIELSYLTNNTSVDFAWSTSDKSVAVVSDSGVLTLLKEGFVTVSIYDANNVSNREYNARYNLQIKGEVEVDYIARFIRTALRENGTKEEVTNIQKYGAWYPNNGQPWCAMFVSWCWYHAGLSTDLLCKYQGCYTGMKWCTEQGIMHFVQDYNFSGETMLNGASNQQYKEDYQPKSGDIIFFLSSGMSHTGIAIYADDTYVYTIEGNTSDMVAVKRWDLKDSRITGYASPKYPECSTREDFSWIATEKVNGNYWWTNVTPNQKVD